MSTDKQSLLRSGLELAFYTSGIYAAYITYGFYQEMIFSGTYGGDTFSYAWFLAFVQCTFQLLGALIMLMLFKQPEHNTPWSQFALLAAAYLGAMVSSNSALGYINYPTQVLTKSCKMIPVMIGRWFTGSPASREQLVEVGLVTLGISVFFFFAAGASSKTTEADNLPASYRMFGMLLLLLSLVFDAYVGPNQEKIQKTFKLSESQMMVGLNTYCIIGAAVLGLFEFVPALTFIMLHPEILWHIFMFGFLSAVGQTFIVFAVFKYNSLVQTTITTTRKFFTILFSVFWYSHTVTSAQWLGVLTVFFGLGLNVYNKSRGNHTPISPPAASNSPRSRSFAAQATTDAFTEMETGSPSNNTSPNLLFPGAASPYSDGSPLPTLQHRATLL